MRKFKLIFLAAAFFFTMNLKAQDLKEAFYGMWTLEIEGGSVGWLGVNANKGFLDADLLWQGGSVVPVSNVYFTDDKTLVVTRTNDLVKKNSDESERKFVSTQTFTFKRIENKVYGTLVSPARDGLGVSVTQFTGWKLPDVGPKPDLSKVKFGKPVTLFNSKDLTGWQLINPNQVNGFKVINGELVNDPVAVAGKNISYGNLRTNDVFEDFNLKIEVNVPEHSNSGVYLRGMYEIQVLDSYGKELDSHNMGGVYSRITPTVSAEKPGGQWQTLDITLCERYVTVILNGKKIIDNQPVYGPTGGAIIADVFKPGPIYLQGDHGKVSFRNIVLTPIIK